MAMAHQNQPTLGPRLTISELWGWPHSVARVSTLFMCLSVAAPAWDGSPPVSAPELPRERIIGTERFGWDQHAADAAELATFRYAIYVDGARSELTGVSCASVPRQAGFACSAPLPPLSPGSHTLEISTFIVNDEGVLESARSAPLYVVLAATAFSTAAGLREGALVTTSDGALLRVDVLTTGLSAPRDLAFAPDDRMFVAERDGTLRIVRQGRLQPDAARVPDEVVTAGGGGLLALARDPEFLRTGHLYLLYTARGRGGGPVFRLTRFREVNGTLGEAAVLLDDVRASVTRPSASVRFGPDGKLYVALGDADDQRPRGEWASYNGTILRLNPDGTTPADQPSGSPVLVDNLRWPRAFDWHPETNALWIAHAGADESERLISALSGGRPSTRAAVAARYALSRGAGVAAMAFSRGARIPALRNDLLIAAGEDGHILRLRIDGQPGNVIAAERLLDDRLGPVRVVAVSPRGEIYFCTDTILGRLVPA